MSDGPTIFVAPTGRRLESDAEPGVLGTFSHSPATEARLELARKNFTEMREQDFIVEGDRWMHKHSDLVYEVVRFDPMLSHDVAGVACFVASGGNLLFLRRVDWQEQTESKPLGEISSYVVGSADGNPRPGSVPSRPSDGKGWYLPPLPPPADGEASG